MAERTKMIRPQALSRCARSVSQLTGRASPPSIGSISISPNKPDWFVAIFSSGKTRLLGRSATPRILSNSRRHVMEIGELTEPYISGPALFAFFGNIAPGSVGMLRASTTSGLSNAAPDERHQSKDRKLEQRFGSAGGALS